MTTMTREIIQIDEERCNGCGKCVPSCEEGAIRIINGKAKLISDKYCDGLGACLADCPQDALKIVKREAAAFDEAAVEALLAASAPKAAAAPQSGGGCPGSQARSFAPKPVAAPQQGGGCPGSRTQSLSPKPAAAAAAAPAASALSHWPIQIRLLSPQAPFLNGADLLVAADCVPVAYPNFHQDMLEGKVVMMGCPKFDDVQAYIQKFAELFAAADVASVTVAVMQVPCCQGMPQIVRNGMEMAGKKLPIEVIVVSLEGEILQQYPVA